MNAMSAGEDLIAERRRRRRAGDPRLSPDGRALFRRMATGDLADELQAALDADVDADSALGADAGDECPERRVSVLVPGAARHRPRLANRATRRRARSARDEALAVAATGLRAPAGG